MNSLTVGRSRLGVRARAWDRAASCVKAEGGGRLIASCLSNSAGDSPSDRDRPIAIGCYVAADIVVHRTPARRGGLFLFPSLGICGRPDPPFFPPDFSPVREMSLLAVPPRRISRRRRKGSLIYKILCRDPSDLVKEANRNRCLPFPFLPFLRGLSSPFSPRPRLNLDTTESSLPKNESLLPR